MATAVTDSALIPELDAHRQDFLAAKGRVRELVSDLSDEQFNWRPSENEWSTAECLDHLVSVGTQMMKPIDAAIEKAQGEGVKGEPPFKYGFLGNWFIEAAGDSERARRRKFKAPALYAPTSNHTISRLEKAMTEMQDDLVLRVERANGLDLKKIRVTSPVTSLLRLSLGQWFVLLTGHQRRHFYQAEEIIAKLPE